MKTPTILVRTNLLLTVVTFVLFIADIVARLAMPDLRSLLDMPLSVAVLTYLVLTPLLAVASIFLTRSGDSRRRTSYLLLIVWGIAIAFWAATAIRIRS